MGASLLTLVQRAARELGLPVPPTVAGSTDTQTQQLFGLANAVGAELLTVKEWTALQMQGVVNVQAVVTGTANIVQGSTTLSNVLASLGFIDDAADWVVSGTGFTPSTRLVSRVVAFPGSATVDIPANATATATPIVLARDTYSVPVGFVSFINDTQWDRGNRWRLRGPSSPQMDQWMRSGIVPTGPRRWFRQVGRGLDVFRLWPPPSGGDRPGPLVYEYLSNAWAETNFPGTGTPSVPKQEMVFDTDSCVFDDRVMVAGIKYMYFANKGFDATRLERDYRLYLQTAMGRDGGAPTLDMSRRRWPSLITSAQTPDGNFPGPGF